MYVYFLYCFNRCFVVLQKLKVNAKFLIVFQRRIGESTGHTNRIVFVLISRHDFVSISRHQFLPPDTGAESLVPKSQKVRT